MATSYSYKQFWKERGKRPADKWTETKQNQVETILSGLKFSKVLELGCGDGQYSRILKKFNCYLTGLDISESRLERNDFIDCKINHNITEVDNLTSYDLVTCSHFLLHIKPKDMYTVSEKIKLAADKHILLIEPHPLIDLGEWVSYNFNHNYKKYFGKPTDFVQLDDITGAYYYEV